MGKRSDFERKPRDFYPTPFVAVEPLIGHLQPRKFKFSEPCAGDGQLCRHLEYFGGESIWASETYKWTQVSPAVAQLFLSWEIRDKGFKVVLKVLTLFSFV